MLAGTQEGFVLAGCIKGYGKAKVGNYSSKNCLIG